MSSQGARHDLEFDSHGDRCAAWLYPAASEADNAPIVVMAHGLSGTRRDRLGPFAERFAAIGCAAMVFDHRGFGDSGGEPDLDWESLARPNQTVVIYMGLSMAAPIAARLLAAGRAGSTPALIVENASRADERRVAATLAGLAEAAATLHGPALLIVGEAMALALPTAHPRESGDPSDIEAEPLLSMGSRVRGNERSFK